jgi:putative ABC transport system permease protein
MTRWVARLAACLVPTEWRADVVRDVEEEARPGQRGALWQSAQVARVGAKMRWTFGGDVMLTDLRYAIRSLLGAKWFTLGAIATFALGIGINLAVFSAVDRLLFKHLPYSHPETLVLLKSCDASTGACGGSFPTAIAFHLTQHSDAFEEVAVGGFAEPIRLTREQTDEPALSFVAVSPRALRVLGVSPAIGRDLSDAEIASQTRGAWISDEAWRSRFHSDLGTVGRTVWLGNTPVSVLGVLPRGFIPPSWSSQSATWTGLVVEYSGNGWVAIAPTGRLAAPFARLRPGITVAAAQAELDAIRSALAGDSKGPNAPSESLRVDPMETTLFSQSRAYLWLVVVTAGLVLLMCCANLASLFIARSRAREQLTAICTALGASSARLIVTAILESVLVCTAGAAAAIVVLATAQKALSTLLPPIFSRYTEGLTDPRVIGFSLLATLACAMIAGVFPGWRLGRLDVLPLLQRGARSTRRARRRGGRGLLVIEAALGAMLVLGAVLAVRSFVVLTQEDLGFQPQGLYLVYVGAGAGPSDPIAQAASMQEKLELLRQMPDVSAVGSSDYIPATNAAPIRPFAKDVRGPRVQVSSGYFEALGVPLIAGRVFTDAEIATQAPLAMMDRLGARRVWPDLDPAQVVGLVWQPSGELPRTIVGIVGSIKPDYGSGPRADPQPTAYLPLGAQPTRLGMALIRMRPGHALQLSALKSFLQARQSDARVTGVDYLPDAMDPVLRDPRFRAALLTTFALTALLLAAVGLYAVASYDAALRRYEMGVRLTLGASPTDLRRLVLRETCWPVAIGCVAGLLGAWWIASLAQSLLYRTNGREPMLYVLVVAILLAVAAAAAWLPARRVAGTNPAIVLRTP